MIKSIHLVNWRSHEHSKLEFHKGTNLLVGIMGAGKSSIVEGISFAFFGTFPALERRKLKMEDIVRLNEAMTKVILEFEWDGVLYRIERSIHRSKKGTTSEAELFKNAALMEHGSVAVTSYIEALTGVDYDLFTRAIYSEQNNIDYFLNIDPRRRKQEIDTLLGLDRFESARSNIISVINTIRSKKEVLEGRFNKMRLTELEQTEKHNDEKVNSLNTNLQTATSSYEKTKTELGSTSRAFENMKRGKDLFEKLEREILQLSSLSVSLKKETADIDEIAYAEAKKVLHSFSTERSNLNTRVKLLDEDTPKLSRELGSTEAKLKHATDSKIRLEHLKKDLLTILEGRGLDHLISEQKEDEKSLISVDSERKSLEHDLAELTELLVKLKPGTSECPLCASQITDIAHIKSEKSKLIEQKKIKIIELVKFLSDKKKSINELQEKSRKVSILSEQISSIERELSDTEKLQSKRTKLEDEIVSLHKEKQVLGKKLDELSGLIDKLRIDINNFENMLRKKKELGLIDKQLSDAQIQASTIQFDAKTFDSLRDALEKSRLASERIFSEKQSLETELQSCREMLKVIHEELSQLRQFAIDLAALSRLEEELSIYKNALLDTQTNLRTTLIDAINIAMNEIWSIFYPYRNYTSLRLEVTEKDYLFEVNDGRNWKSLESIASGGERASAALTLRVALAMVLTPRLSWLILDEPTHNLDTDAIELLSSAMQFKVPEVVKQTFVITHEEGLMGSDFASSYRLTRDKEHNGGTKIEIV